MTFQQARDRYQRILADYHAGRINEAAFKDVVNKLVVVDAQGRRWQIEPVSGRWFRYADGNWVEDTPPAGRAATGAVPAGAAPARRSTSGWVIAGIIAAVVVVIACLCLLGLALAGLFTIPMIRSIDVQPGPQPFPGPATTVEVTRVPFPFEMTPTPIPVEPSLPAPTVGASETPAVVTPSAAPSALSAEGPWAVFSNETGLWAINPDGSGLSQLVNQPLAFAYNLNQAVSPGGPYLAFLTSTDAAGAYNGLTLKMLSLPGGEVNVVAPLTSPTTELGPNAQPGDPGFDVVIAVQDPTNLQWSPLGDRLAFVGGQEGSSADLYLYTLESGTVTHLSNEQSQAFGPSWSPNGQYLVFFGVNNFGTGAGFEMADAYVADTASGVVRTLYTPQSSGEQVVGWLNDETVVINSWAPDCGNKQLRTVNVVSGDQQMLFAPCFDSAALASGSGSILVAVSSNLANMSSQQSGIYLLASPGSQPQQVSQASSMRVEWSSVLGEFLAVTDSQGLQAFSPQGETQTVPQGMNEPGVTDFPVISPDGTYWALGTKQNLTIYSVNGGPQQVFDGSARSLAWSPNGQALMFSGGQDSTRFYIMPVSSMIPQAISAEAKPAILEQGVWVSRK